MPVLRQEVSDFGIEPRPRGAAQPGRRTTWENIVCACVDCNVRKGGRTPKQAHMTLIRKPEKPKRSPLLSMKLSQKKYRLLASRSWTALTGIVELK